LSAHWGGHRAPVATHDATAFTRDGAARNQFTID
jgi:hypothetical protein